MESIVHIGWEIERETEDLEEVSTCWDLPGNF